MILILDNSVGKNDKLSYIHDLIKTLTKYEIPYVKVNKVQNIDLHQIKGIIITGSSLKLSKISKNGTFYDYGFNLYYLSRLDVPVYGACFGCQLLNILYGGTLIDNKKYICDKIKFNKSINQNHLFDNIETNEFNYCFSDIVIPNKKMNIKIFASIKHEDKIIDCGFVFERNKVFGSLFHPEISTKTDMFYLNFYNLCKKYNGCIK